MQSLLQKSAQSPSGRASLSVEVVVVEVEFDDKRAITGEYKQTRGGRIHH